MHDPVPMLDAILELRYSPPSLHVSPASQLHWSASRALRPSKWIILRVSQSRLAHTPVFHRSGNVWSRLVSSWILEAPTQPLPDASAPMQFAEVTLLKRVRAGGQALKKWYTALGRGGILSPDTSGARNPPGPTPSGDADVSPSGGRGAFLALTAI
ncbi:hypothetical protein R6Z07M_009673 [Ovis aries]